MKSNIGYNSKFPQKVGELIYVEIHDSLDDLDNSFYCSTQKGDH